MRGPETRGMIRQENLLRPTTLNSTIVYTAPLDASRVPLSLSLMSQVVNLTSRSIKSFAYRITFASVGRQHACALPYPNLSLLTILAHHDLLTFSSSHESTIVIALIMEFMIPLEGTIRCAVHEPLC